jgi:predicted enzyme related to lactoylglutathione lyase
MLAIGTIVLGAEDVPRAIAFWSEALHYVPRDEPEDDWVVLAPSDGPGQALAIDLSTTAAEKLPRIHLDLYAGDAADQAAEVERLVAIGAERVEWDLYPEDADYIVLADTEGNLFCVIDTVRDGAKPA